MSRPRRVRTVRPRSFGSGTRFLDEIQWPKSLYYGSSGVRWAVKHWKVSGPVTVLLVAWSGAGLQGVLLFGVLGGAGLFGWLRWHRAAEGGAGVGKLNVEDMRHRLTLQKQWGLACRTAKLLGPETGDPPPLRQLRGDGHGTFTATVKSGEVGVPVFAIEKQTAALSEVIGCREVVATSVRPGVARLAFHWRDPIGRALPLADLPISTSPGHVAYGIRQDGSVATVNATQSILIGGLTRKGKALALDTPVPTPTGWTTMGEIREGDVVYSETGTPCTVTDAWEVRYDRPCYRVMFSDGSSIVADAEHQWAVDTAASRQSASMAQRRVLKGGSLSRPQKRALPQVLTTEQMAGTQRTTNTNQRANYSIPVAGALEAPEVDLPVPPYTLGAWLGDGTSASSNFTTADTETLLVMASEGVDAYKMDCGGPYLYGLRFLDADTASRQTCSKCPNGAVPGRVVCGAHLPARIPCTRCGEPCRAELCRRCRPLHGPSMTAALRRAGVLRNKHIPAAYLRASEDQRRALLAGLLDTDGYCSEQGQIAFYNTNERLARDAFHLIASLGYKPTIRSKTARLEGRDCGLVWTVSFTAADKVFRLQRKAERQVLVATSTTRTRYIVSIEPVDSVPVRCIAVDSPNHLFLVGEACIATHNSNLVWALLADVLRQGIYVDLYVSDPKGGVELDQLEAQLGLEGPRLLRVRQYAKTAAETVKMLEAAEKGMHARQYWMKQNGARKISPDQTNPLVVTILDETLPLTDLLKKGTDSALGRVAYTGAAAAYVVWANTQVAQVDALGRFRDLVPQRICFATPNPQVTDSVLGQGSETMGAYCSDIQEPGVGYSHSEGDKVARKFRAAMVTDDETKLIAQGLLPPAVVNKAREAWDRAAEGPVSGKSRGARRTALYRWFYVDDPEYGDSLGYVGISYDVIHREAQHTAGLRAFMEGNVRRETQWFPSRGEAVAAETLAIATEKPIWNKQHNGGNSRRRIDRFRRDKVA
jgi:hypothetical protein